MQIIPAILATSEEQYQEELSQIEESGLFEWVHIDLIDNKFVQNQTVGLETVKKYPTKLKKEIHLMVEEPEEWLVEGADRIIIHQEIGQEKVDLFKRSHLDTELCLAFNPETEVKSEDFPDLLIMSIHPGFQGQQFIPESIEKIKKAKLLGKRVGVDGGVSIDNVKMILDAGADWVVIGSHLFKGDIDENIEKIWEKIKS